MADRTDREGNLQKQLSTGQFAPATVQIDLDGGVVLAGAGGGGGGAGTEYTEDAAAPANPVGGVLQARRRDTLTAAEVSADGDVITVNATAKGEVRVSDADLAALIGPVTETAPASDTASSGLNGRLQRVAQRLASISLSLINDAVVNASLPSLPIGWYNGTTTRAVSATNPLPITAPSDLGVLPSATENHLGSVGSNTAALYVAPTIASSSHAANTVVGGKITLTNWSRVAGLGSRALSMSLRWGEATPPAALDFLFFRTDPSTNVADAASFTWGTSLVDAGSAFGFHVRVTAAEWTPIVGTSGTVNMCTKLLGVGFVPSTADAKLYIVTPNTFTPAANALSATFKADRD